MADGLVADGGLVCESAWVAGSESGDVDAVVLGFASGFASGLALASRLVEEESFAIASAISAAVSMSPRSRAWARARPSCVVNVFGASSAPELFSLKPA